MNPLRILVILLLAAVVPVSPVFGTSLQQEIDLGKKIDAMILKQYSLTSDQEALQQINEYGERLIENVRRPEIEYHFRILKDDQLNAFSTPGGFVYFSERLWKTLRDEERIGVLAHEIVHTDRRHALDAISKQQRRRLWMSAALLVAGAGQLWCDVAGLAESLYSLKYSRKDEQQADEIGVELCEKAGYDPAGLLLAMRKIQRFQGEAGSEPPKIFSSHPPTPERLEYLTALLNSKNIEIPPENVAEVPNPYKIGTVTRVDQRTVYFSHTEPLYNDDVVWLMKLGWDYHYENRTPVAFARGVVTGASEDGTLIAEVWQMSGTQKGDVAVDVGVYAPPTPDIGEGMGIIQQIDPKVPTVGRLDAVVKPKMLDRLLARQIVWDLETAGVTVDNVGYVIITDPDHELGFVAVQRGKYTYAPVAAGSTLIPLVDPDQDRWVGPVISIGRGGKTIEVLPNRSLNFDKTYDLVYPMWDAADRYEKRVIAKARYAPDGTKVVLKITGFRTGWSMDRIVNALDVYEEAEKTEDADEDPEADPDEGSSE